MKEAESFCEPRAVCSLEILEKEDFGDLYRKEWGNALCSARKSSDEIAVAAYVDGEIAALAGASRDCEEMWQIGVDVRTEFRGLNLGCAVVHKLAAEILSRGKIPFYCAAWSNIRSVRTALKCGFFPAWVQLTAKIVEFVDMLSAYKLALLSTAINENILTKNKKNGFSFYHIIINKVSRPFTVRERRALW